MKPFRVRLNFHGDLNFFLGSRTSSASIERHLAEKASVKDVIESCGVPHPEVDLILVNGRAVGFEYGLEHTADVEVFPVATQPPYFKQNRLQVDKWRCFIADGHLGKFWIGDVPGGIGEGDAHRFDEQMPALGALRID